MEVPQNRRFYGKIKIGERRGGLWAKHIWD
jgi:hypothetical protein